jgi:hypothetical protein
MEETLHHLGRLKLDHFYPFMALFEGLKLETHPKNHGMNKAPASTGAGFLPPSALSMYVYV